MRRYLRYIGPALWTWAKGIRWLWTRRGLLLADTAGNRNVLIRGSNYLIFYKPGWGPLWPRPFLLVYLTTYLAGTIAGYGVVSLSRAWYERSQKIRMANGKVLTPVTPGLYFRMANGKVLTPVTPGLYFRGDKWAHPFARFMTRLLDWAFPGSAHGRHTGPRLWGVEGIRTACATRMALSITALRQRIAELEAENCALINNRERGTEALRIALGEALWREGHPAGTVAKLREEWAKFREFYLRHSSMEKHEPLCFICGKQKWRIAIAKRTHPELPNIYVCGECCEAIDERDRLRVALEPFTRIKADDGDDFSTWPDGVTIRCEITTTELRKAREVLNGNG